MGNVTVVINVVDDQSTPEPIDDVLVRVHDENDVFVTDGLTGATVPGQVEFTLPGDDPGIAYILRPYKVGVSFLPQPRVDIVVTDPAPSPFAITGHVGETAMVATLIAGTADTVPVPIPGVLFRLYSIPEVFLTEAVADSQGQVKIALPPDSYIVRPLLAGWIFSNGPTQVVEVLDPLPIGGTNTFDFPAAQPVLPQSTDPDMCLITGYLIDDSGRPLRNVKFRIMPILTNPEVKMSGFPGAGDPGILTRRIILQEMTSETDEAGYAEIMLPRDSNHDIHIYGFEVPSVPNYASIHVPDASFAKLEDILFPFTASVVFDPDSLTLHIGDYETMTMVITGSNGQILDNQYSTMFLDIVAANPDLIGISVAADGTVGITALAVGSTSINATRSSSKTTYAPRHPDVPDLVVTPVSITIIP